MSTGTGIFLAGIFIGLVMLHGQTKDRWNWGRISYYFFIFVLLSCATAYHALKDWEGFVSGWTLKGIIASFLVIFMIAIIAGIPHYIANQFYEKVKNEDFEYDEDGNERKIYKISVSIFSVIFLIVLIFYGEFFKTRIIGWIAG